jgi:hypothetical protein
MFIPQYFSTKDVQPFKLAFQHQPDSPIWVHAQADIQQWFHLDINLQVDLLLDTLHNNSVVKIIGGPHSGHVIQLTSTHLTNKLPWVSGHTFQPDSLKTYRKAIVLLQ